MEYKKSVKMILFLFEWTDLSFNVFMFTFLFYLGFSLLEIDLHFLWVHLSRESQVLATMCQHDLAFTRIVSELGLTPRDSIPVISLR